ncbi:MAG TPA: class E sortase [Candidatus Saccharimonadales bacterium]|nr:class E sortase [Candidatus Saccharimonadales bacterium]
MNIPAFLNGNQNSNSGGFLPPGINPAVELIRQKLARIYSQEPDAKQELSEVQASKFRSKHQQFMQALAASGKSWADVQTEWHNYYVNLPDDQKHQVWQEFYESNALVSQYNRAAATPEQAGQRLAAHKNEVLAPKRPPLKAIKTRLAELRNPEELREAIRNTVTAGGKLKAKHHLQSLLFGAATAMVVMVIFLFGFFNEVVIAPFIQPSRHAGSTPFIIDPGSVAPTATPEVIIPKINVEIPAVYGTNSIDEEQIQDALMDGVVHYPTTVLPGQQGNTAFFGHSSNNIFNKGKYKFAFVLLHTLVPGDTFYLTNGGKVYVYKVISRNIVEPGNTSVLGPVPNATATATLITCDPPGTSLHRLVVVGEQISPDPAANTTATAVAIEEPAALPGNGPTLWSRFWHWVF